MSIEDALIISGFSGDEPDFLICSIVTGVLQVGRHSAFPPRKRLVVRFSAIVCKVIVVQIIYLIRCCCGHFMYNDLAPA